MYEIDGCEREDNPPRLKRKRRVFPRPTYKASSACALRCAGAANSCEYVHGGAIAVVIIFRENFVQKSTCKFGLHYKGRRCDSACLILPSENQAHFLFRIRYYKRRSFNVRIISALTLTKDGILLEICVRIASVLLSKQPAGYLKKTANYLEIVSGLRVSTMLQNKTE